MELPPSSEQEAWLKEPEKRRRELLACLPLGVADEKFASDMRSAREDHNCYWAKRMVCERAGWPRVLDKPRLREGVRELEQALWDAWDIAEGGRGGVGGAEEGLKAICRSAWGLVVWRVRRRKICRQAVCCLVQHFIPAASTEMNARMVFGPATAQTEYFVAFTNDTARIVAT